MNIYKENTDRDPELLSAEAESNTNEIYGEGNQISLEIAMHVTSIELQMKRIKWSKLWGQSCEYVG